MQKQELILKVLEKCYFISNNSECDVFFSYSPHVNFYEVCYHLEGWKQNESGVYINISTDVNVKNLTKTLQELDKLWKIVNKTENCMINSDIPEKVGCEWVSTEENNLSN